MINLNSSTNDSIALSIIIQDDALGGLARLLFACDKPDVQEKVAWAFQNLATANDISSHHHIFQKIVNEVGALADLVECFNATSEHCDV